MPCYGSGSGKTRDGYSAVVTTVLKKAAPIIILRAGRWTQGRPIFRFFASDLLRFASLVGGDGPGNSQSQ
jgi:hypothetical protein